MHLFMQIKFGVTNFKWLLILKCLPEQREKEFGFWKHLNQTPVLNLEAEVLSFRQCRWASVF